MPPDVLNAHAPPGANFLAMQNVDVARGDAIVLHDIALEIAMGEHVAILGPNGCGKSTLIKTITRECYPMVRPAGEPAMCCTLLGRGRWDLSQLRSQLGVVSADLPGERTPVTSGRDAVIAGFFGASAIWPNHTVTAEMEKRADAALASLHAAHLGAKLVGQMSAGEQRRVMIARAMVHRPAMLLLDEPSNALDLAAQRDGDHYGDASSGRHPTRDRSRDPDAGRPDCRRWSACQITDCVDAQDVVWRRSHAY